MANGQQVTDPGLAHAVPDFIDGRQACADKDPEIFFPSAENAAEAMPAIRICRLCPLRTACGTWALNTRQNFGIWGGLSPRMRRAILRRNGDGR